MELLEDGSRYAIASINRFEQVKTCLFSECDSWALKAEMLLTHLAFVLGFSTPNQLILRALKELISGVSTKLATYIDDYPELEQFLRIVISGLNQLALDHVWDLVRDSSVCMRLNTCDNDFLRQISNIKIKVCDIEDPSDTLRKVTVCEKMFNDSPLIILAGVMLILMAFSNGHLKSAAANKPNENNAVNPDNNPANNSGPSQPPSVLHSPQAEVVTGPPSTNNEEQPPPGNEQVIHALCPKCNKNFDCTVPRPWPLYCAENFALIEKLPKNSSNATELREILKKIKCIYCKAQIKKFVKDLEKRKKKPSK
ncbi:hypothetical protein Ocin01_01241 [Orchesella cincta]|uniref:Uncharacterized protein n=1 Tax=Orchesella cincta TaxID=48709 RepID=A0A1D2NJL4_ORCCI|nr:hypothetical protein Ocin01_01241 [Orchesella cincta]